MQIACFRRGVVAPMDEYSKEIECGCFRSPVRVEFIPIDDQLFDLLWNEQIFHILNKSCGLRIDDYEEEEICSEKLPHAIDAVDKIIKSKLEVSDIIRFLEMLKALMQNAIKNNVSIWFVL